jgi:hypothetical protein
MIVAMIPVWMMEMTIDQIIDVVPVRHGFMPAAFAVDVPLLVTAAVRRAGIGVRLADLQHVLVYVVAVDVVQVAVVEIVRVPFVLDGRVTAAGAVLVVVSLVLVAFHSPTPSARGDGGSDQCRYCRPRGPRGSTVS